MKKTSTLLLFLTMSLVEAYAQRPPCGSLSAPTITGQTVTLQPSTASVAVSWSSVGATRYALLYKRTSETLYRQVCSGASTFSCTIDGLSLGNEYHIKVEATRACQHNPSEPDTDEASTITTLRLPPRAPAPFATRITPVSFTATWSRVQLPDDTYKIDVSANSSFTGPLVLDNVSVFPASSVCEKAITGLVSGRTYYFRVRTVVKGRVSQNSNTVTVNEVVPQPPTPAISEITNTTFSVSWPTVPGATAGYQLDVSSDCNFLTGNIFTNFAVTDTRFIVSQLLPNVTYYARVRAVNSVGPSANSTRLQVTMPPLPPANLLAAQITDSGFIASWSPSTGANRYLVEVATDLNFTDRIRLSEVGNPSIAYINLTAGTTYFFHVSSLNSTSSPHSPYSATQSVLLMPATPTVLFPVAITASSFIARWQPVGIAAHFFVDVSTDPAFNTVLFANLDAGQSNELTINDLNSGTTYYYRVRSSNVTGTSANSTSASAETRQDLSIVSELETSAQVALFPNPTSARFNVVLNLPDPQEHLEIRVLTPFGKMVTCLQRNNVQSLNEVIDISNQPRGIYTVQISYRGQIFHKKIVNHP